MPASTIPGLAGTQLENPTGLLALSAELRNTIYYYVLSHPHALLASCFSVPAQPNLTPVPKLYLRYQSIEDQTSNHIQTFQSEANQLRYVCRQLYHETRALSLHYNDIVIWHDGTATALATCNTFLSLVSSSHQKRMRKVIVVEALPDPGAILMSNIRRWQQIGQTLTGTLHPC
ncbi:hypothetical protein PtrCC142_006365, partial [Pyrenophora tritici-repentis]